MKFFQSCGTNEQVLGETNNKPFFPSAAAAKISGRAPVQQPNRQQFHHGHRPKSPVPPTQEYQYVRMEYGYDYAPPSLYVPPHTVEESVAARSARGGPIIDGQRPLIFEPGSDISGSESDEEYIAAPTSRRGDRARDSRSTSRPRESRREAVPIPPSPHGSVRRFGSVHQDQLNGSGGRRRPPTPQGVERTRSSGGDRSHRQQQRRPSRGGGGEYRDEHRPREDYPREDPDHRLPRRQSPGHHHQHHRNDYYDESPGRDEGMHDTYPEHRDDMYMREGRDDRGMRHNDRDAAPRMIIDRVPMASEYHSDASDEEMDAKSRMSRYSVGGDREEEMFTGVWGVKRSEPMHKNRSRKNSKTMNGGDWDENYDINRRNHATEGMGETGVLGLHESRRLPPQILPHAIGPPPQQLVQARLDEPVGPPRRPVADDEYEYIAPISKNSQRSPVVKEKRGRSIFGRMRDTVVRRKNSMTDKSLEMYKDQRKDINRSTSKDRSRASRGRPPSPFAHPNEHYYGEVIDDHEYEGRDSYHHQSRPGRSSRPAYHDDMDEVDSYQNPPRYRSRSPYHHRETREAAPETGYRRRPIPPSHNMAKHLHRGPPPSPSGRRGDAPAHYRPSYPPQSPYQRSGRRSPSPFRRENSFGHF